MTNWTRMSGDRVRLRFDGEATERKTVHVDGWIPAPSPDHGGASTPATFSIPAPWPSWPGAEVESGVLTVSASGAREAKLEARGGAVPTISGPSATGSAGLVSTSYRGPRTDEPQQLRWSDEPPKVAVRVDSLLTVFPNSALWKAIARYSVSGGSMEVVRLKFPTAWTGGLEIETPGVAIERTETDGASTILTLRLKQPIWGARDFHFRAERPLPSDGPLVVPDLLPQGRGTFLTDVAIDDASGRDLALEGSSGLQPIESSRLDAAAFPSSPGVRRSVFKVNAPGRWSLRVRPIKPPPSGPVNAKVALADYKITLGADGRAFGRAHFDIEAGASQYLSIHVPAGLEPLAAEVDGRPTQPLERASGRLLIPLRGRESTRAALIWRSPARSTRVADRRALEIPTPDAVGAPMIVEVLAADDVEVEIDSPQWERLADPLLQAERLEWAGQRIFEHIERIAKGSPRTRAGLLRDIVGFQLQCRRVSRSAGYLAADGSTRSAETGAASLRTREEAARSSVAQALSSAGLEELDRTSRIMIGSEPPTGAGSKTDLGLPDVLEEAEPPTIGISRAFLGELSADHAPRIWRRPRQRSTAVLFDGPTWLCLTTTGFGLLIGLAFASSGRPRSLIGSALLTSLIAGSLPVASLFSPLLVLAAALGWFTSRR